MEARLEEELPGGAGWQYEPKWDGFRCLAFRAGADVDIRAKSGKPLARYFPDIVEALGRVPLDRFVVDGELVIPVGDTLSFEALQLRLHPAASRVARLAAESPARMVAFDLLVDPDGRDLSADPLRLRRKALEGIMDPLGASGVVALSPVTDSRDKALGWLDRAGAALDGIVAKRLDDTYQSGERAMVKVKRLRTADCVVGGFRYGTRSRLVGSLLLGLYTDDGKLDHVGFTSAIPEVDRPELTRRLEALAGGPGFTGRAPGGPSRWSTERSTEWTPLRHELVVEVRYDQVTGDRFRHGTAFLRWRPDKAPRQCTMEQLRQEARPVMLMADLGES
jgi:ATP-dependent DNA ligase